MKIIKLNTDKINELLLRDRELELKELTNNEKSVLILILNLSHPQEKLTVKRLLDWYLFQTRSEAAENPHSKATIRGHEVAVNRALVSLKKKELIDY
jgi:hypothetical protein